MAPAPLDDPWHEDLLLLATHAQRHEQDALGGQPISRLEREHLVEIALVRYHELEPGAELPESLDHVRPETSCHRHACVRELERDVPLIDGQVRRWLGARRLEL